MAEPRTPQVARALAPPAHSPEELAELLKMRPPYGIADLAKIPRLLTTLEALLAEVERLRAQLNLTRAAGGLANASADFAEEQRDALADALVGLIDQLADLTLAEVAEWAERNPAAGKPNKRRLAYRAAVTALRAAGRLGEEDPK